LDLTLLVDLLGNILRTRAELPRGVLSCVCDLLRRWLELLLGDRLGSRLDL
jgi:hypothetical protein